MSVERRVAPLRICNAVCECVKSIVVTALAAVGKQRQTVIADWICLAVQRTSSAAHTDATLHCQGKMALKRTTYQPITYYEIALLNETHKPLLRIIYMTRYRSR